MRYKVLFLSLDIKSQQVHLLQAAVCHNEGSQLEVQSQWVEEGRAQRARDVQIEP